jgi:hypothetical protein
MHKKRHALVAIAVVIGMLMPVAALAQDGAPPRRGLAAVNDEGVTATVHNREQTSGPVDVVVYLNKRSLARAGARMTSAQRARYAASVSELQNKVAAKIEALGGVVVGRFEMLSSGLAVSIDAAKIGDLREIPGVVTVRKAIDYQLELSETVPWIGAAGVQALGVGGAGVDVAVIDTGADYTHVKLGGPGTAEDYVDAYCGPSFDPTMDGPVSPTNPACAAHAAKDETGLFPGSKIAGGYDWLGDLWPIGSTTILPDPNPIDFHGHGTHVADIIAGLPGGGVGPGVAPGAKLWSFKACSSLLLVPSPAGSSACNGLSVLLAIDDAADLDDDPKTLDPADVINLSLGAIYGQPEDDLTAFANEATLIGAIVVAGAGNAGDKPFIVASPATASGAIGVAWTSRPSEMLVKIDTSASDVYGRFQAWSAPPTATVSGMLVYDTTSSFTQRGCVHDDFGNHLGSPWMPGQYAGQVLLMDRGGCAVSHKVSNAATAGAVLAIVANNVPQPPYEPPPGFPFGGGTPSIPGYTITLIDGDALKADALGAVATADPVVTVSLQDTLILTSSRGPRNNDNAIKPDIGAPGVSVSARVSTGGGAAAFSGTSGASAMVAGAAALLKQKYGGAALPRPFADEFGSEMPVYMFKALLMNTATTEVYLGAEDLGAPLAPITLIGSGRLDALGAFNAQTIAWDETDRRIAPHSFTGDDDDCDDDEECDEAGRPIDPRFRTGSMSFGYQTITRREVAVRRGVVANLSDEGRWYDLSASFRYAEDENRGVSLKVYPKRLYVPAGSHRAFFVKMRIDAETLHDWPFLTPDAVDKGLNGANGGALTRQEYDGTIHIDGGEHNTVHLVWHVLPKRVAAIRPMRHTLGFGQHVTRTLTLRNSAMFQDGDVDVFSLVDRSPNATYYPLLDDIGFIDECTSGPPGPGCNETPIDIKEVGVRDLFDTYIEFGVTIWDSPYRSSQVPVEFDIFVDSNLDGNNDWVVLNYPLNNNLSDGRNAVWVCKPDFTDCTIPFFLDSGFNTQNWILAVPASAIGVAPGQRFNFQVRARDLYFSGEYTDVSPADGVTYHTYTMGWPRYAVDNLLPVVPAAGETLLTVTRSAEGEAASPSQIGLLLMYRQAPLERESDSVTIEP